jgi:ribosomal-protein-alanine N-acetyltransferase
MRRLLNSPGWIRHISDLNISSDDDAADYIRVKLQNEYRTQGMGLWIAIEKSGGEAIGLCGLLRRSHLKHVDLGYAFLPDFQGQGYAREAAAACIEYGYSNIGLDRIIAVTRADNQRSIRLLQALGMQFIDTVKWPSGATLQVYG